MEGYILELDDGDGGQFRVRISFNIYLCFFVCEFPPDMDLLLSEGGERGVGKMWAVKTSLISLCLWRKQCRYCLIEGPLG